MGEFDVKMTALLIWLVQQGGAVNADDSGLDRYTDDAAPGESDTINRAFQAGLAEQIQHGDDWFSVRITDAGRRSLAPGGKAEAEMGTHGQD